MDDLGAAWARLDHFVERKMESERIPGVALAVTDRDQVVRVATYGLRDIEAQLPITPLTLFEIGSLSKSFSALVLLQEHSAGRLDLHAPVTEYLPWFHIPSRFAPITVHHLLTHTAGIVSSPTVTLSSRYGVFALRETEAAWAPGKRWSYSNVGYDALGYLLEDLLNQPFGDILQTRVLDPLGMTLTNPVITHETRKRQAVGYRRLYDDRPEHRSHPLVPAPWQEFGRASGSVAATAGDMAIYLRMLLNRGQGPHGPLLSEQGFARLTEPVIAAWPGTFYGYGLVTCQRNGHTYISHGGGMLGFQASMVGDLDAGVGIVVLMNVPGTPLEIAEFGLALLSAARAADPLPALPPLPAPARVVRAPDYPGVYTCGTRRLTVIAEEEHVILQHGVERIILEQRGPDTFWVNHPDFALFLLRFGRADGQVVEMFHGPDWYTNASYDGPTTFDHPAIWAAYPGHYRSHRGGESNVRVVLRKGTLIFCAAQGAEIVLEPLDEGLFRMGEEEPDRIRFDTIVQGQALQLNLSGGDYFRIFTS